MLLTTELINGKDVLIVAPETDNEARRVSKFAAPLEPLTAKITTIHLRSNPLIIIRKESK